MTEDRRRVLDMLSEGKVSVDEAERLLQALQGTRRVEAPEGGGMDVQLPGREDLQNTPEEIEGNLEGELEGDLEGALEGRLEGDIEGELEGLEDSLARWSEEEKGGGEKDGKRSMRDDTFTVGDKPRLEVRGFSGRVRVNSGSPGTIRVRAKLKDPRRIEYNAVQEGDRVKVEARPDRQSEGILPGPFGRHSGVNIEVVVPVATAVDLETSNGPVEVRGTEGGGTLMTTNGRIKVEGFKGELEATTSNGAVTLKTFSGSAVLATSNSRIAIEDGRGRFEARTTNGSVKFQGSMEPGSRNRLSTTNGNIKVALVPDPSLKLTAGTVNGRVRCEVPGFVATEDRRRKVEGTVGQGEAELTARTTNGSIAIQ